MSPDPMGSSYLSLALAVCQYILTKGEWQSQTHLSCEERILKASSPTTKEKEGARDGQPESECVPLPGPQLLKLLSFAVWNSSTGLGSYHKENNIQGEEKE